MASNNPASAGTQDAKATFEEKYVHEAKKCSCVHVRIKYGLERPALSDCETLDPQEYATLQIIRFRREIGRLIDWANGTFGRKSCTECKEGKDRLREQVCHKFGCVEDAAKHGSEGACGTKGI